MGNLLSNSGRYLIRKTRRFNVENRAHKFIEQNKLPPAPKHPSTSNLLDALTKDSDVREELIKKSISLDENLKHVYVKALHIPEELDQEKENLKKSKLPQERRQTPQSKFGHEIPFHIPEGKYSLSQVIDMITEYSQDSTTNSPQVLANKYNLNVNVVESILFYFRFFKLEVTKEQKGQKKLAQQVMSRFAAKAMDQIQTKKEIDGTGGGVSSSDTIVGYYEDVKQIRSQEIELLKKSKKLQAENEIGDKIKRSNTVSAEKRPRNVKTHVKDTESVEESDKIKSVLENKMEAKIESGQNEVIEENDKDSVYKNVAHRKRKKTETSGK